MIRVGDAALALSRSPFTFVVTILLGRALACWNMGWVVTFLVAGLAMQTMHQAMRSDHAPLPPPSELGRTAGQGCLAGCGLWLAVMAAMCMTIVPLNLLGFDTELPRFGELPSSVDELMSSLVFLWSLQNTLGAMMLARSSPENVAFRQLALNGFFAYFASLAVQLWPGLGLLALLALLVVSFPLCFSSQALLQAVPLLLLLLYAHLFGQTLRKTLGFQVK